MSKRTRIKRPTYSTPRKPPAGRMVHVSTYFDWIPVDPTQPLGPTKFVRIASGNTYRRPA